MCKKEDFRGFFLLELIFLHRENSNLNKKACQNVPQHKSEESDPFDIECTDIHPAYK